MPIESVYNSQVRTIRRKLGNVPDLIVFGDEIGNLYFQDNPALGLVWVRRMQANGTYGKSFLVRGPTKPIKMIPGYPVVLGIDSDNVQRVMDVDFASVQSLGANPLQSAAVDPNTNNNTFVNQQYITTMFAQIVDGTLKVGVRGWLVLDAGTWYKVEGQVDFTGSVPSAGNHCVAVISVLNDYSALEVQYSTAKDMQIPLDLSDLQEAWTATTSTNYPNSAWAIGDGQTELAEANRWADLKQMINIASGSGDVVGPASAVDGDIAVFDGVTGKIIKDAGITPRYLWEMSMAIGQFMS